MWKPKVIELDKKKSVIFGLAMLIIADSSKHEYSQSSITNEISLTVLFIGFIILMCCMIHRYSEKLLYKLNDHRG